MKTLTFENIYPDNIFITYQQKYSTFFTKEQFAPFLKYNTDYPYQEYDAILIKASNLISVWIQEESKLLRELSIDFSTHKFISYLDSFSFSGFCTIEGLELFKEYVTSNMTTSTVFRFQELESMLKLFLDPKAYTALKGRCIYTLLSANKEFVSIAIKTDEDNQAVVLSKEIYDILKEFPWVWMIVLYHVNKVYSVSSLGLISQ